MKETEFLIARPASHGKPQPFIIGETGFSFNDADRPTSIMDVWMDGQGLPVAARDVLAKNPQFSNIVGLIGMATGPYEHRKPSSGWILARASSGLVSISIRNARDCDSGRLANDAELATEEAQRFAAKSVVVLVQASTGKDAEFGRKTMERTFGMDIPELNRLFLSSEGSIPFWVASLSKNI